MKPGTEIAGARFSRRDVFGAAAGALAVGTAFAAALQAAAPEPAAVGAESWVDPVVPEVTHRMIATNGVRIHVVEQGNGPLIILCHGFPECWYSWRHQLPALAQAGFRAVAFDMRGYGRSDRPTEVEKYTLLHHIGDIVGLLDALGADEAVIAGHDVGATIAWEAALLRPDRFRGVIALAVPFRPRVFGSPVPPTSVMPQNADAIFYQLYLQTPEAEANFGRDIRQTFRSAFYALSGNAPRPSDGGAGSYMVPRKGPPLANEPASLPPWISETDIDVYVDEFTRSGFRGPLAWYNDIDLSWELMAAFAGATVTVPALFIAGERDVLVATFQQFILKQPTLVPKLRPVLMLPGCGHWTQQERAQEVSAAMVDFVRQL